VRHPASGAPQYLSRIVACPIINGGDGMHEHPTQALIDLLTIHERCGSFEGLRVSIVGDVLHSRVARSNVFGLRTLGARIRLVGPPTLLPWEFRELGVELCTDLATGVRDADVIMMLRLQRERQGANYVPSLDEYSQYFCLTEEMVGLAQSRVIILHPGPLNRGVEIASAVADGPYSVIMDQVTNGIAVRMAVLYMLVAARKAERVRRARAASPPGAEERPAEEPPAADDRRQSRGAA
jgi:aspartate carbamoyltransferase catalytic subunit